MKIAINRPFGMGRMLYENRELTKSGAFGFILEKSFEGVILNGTKSPDHLEENSRAYNEPVGRHASYYEKSLLASPESGQNSFSVSAFIESSISVSQPT